MARKCREELSGSRLRARRASVVAVPWLVTASFCSLGWDACSVDQRPLTAAPGLVLLSGGDGGDPGIVGGSAGVGASGSEAGEPEAGQPGLGGSGGGAGVPNAGAGEDAGQGGSGGSSGSGGTTGGTTGGSDVIVMGGAGGTSSGAGGSGGTPAGGSSAGAQVGRPIGGCPDLDDDQVADCDETIVQNASFDKDTSDWSTETNLELSWETNDALGHSTSGSLGVEDTFTTDMDGSLMLGARQCVPLDAGTNYVFAMEVLVPAEVSGTSAGFQLIVYDAADCTGGMTDIVSSAVVSGSDWQVVAANYTPQAPSKSAVLRLVSIKPYREAPGNVLFDDVLVHAVQ